MVYLTGTLHACAWRNILVGFQAGMGELRTVVACGFFFFFSKAA